MHTQCTAGSSAPHLSICNMACLQSSLKSRAEEPCNVGLCAYVSVLVANECCCGSGLSWSTLQ